LNTKTITQTGLLLGVALAVQSFHLPTYITGPAINAVLIVAAVFPGILGGVFLGCLTPLAALMMGIVHPIAVPLVPVIMAANTILVTVFYFLRRKNEYVALLAAAFSKYLIFYISVNYLLSLFGIKIPIPLLTAFQLPQLFTALVGGGIGMVIIKYLEKVHQQRS